MLAKLPRNLQHKLERSGGWTVNPRTGEYVTGGGYVVANPPDTVGTVVTDRVLVSGKVRFRPIGPAVRAVVASNGKALSRPNVMLGAWHNVRDSLVHVELSEVYESLDDALRVAGERGELAIYDLANLRDIPVSYHQTA